MGIDYRIGLGPKQTKLESKEKDHEIAKGRSCQEAVAHGFLLYNSYE